MMVLVLVVVLGMVLMVLGMMLVVVLVLAVMVLVLVVVVFVMVLVSVVCGVFSSMLGIVFHGDSPAFATVATSAADTCIRGVLAQSNIRVEGRFEVAALK